MYNRECSMFTDAEWEKWGQRDPYFGVLTDNRFRQKRLTADTKAEFFASGARDIDHVFQVCREHICPDFRPRSALDFGCGVGRLVIPLAALVEHVVGVDVS